MSAVIYGNCPRCGQPFTVEEHTNNVTFTVGGHVVTECPVCGDPLEYPKKEEVQDGG